MFRTLAMIAAIATVLTLPACGGGGSDDTSTDTSGSAAKSCTVGKLCGNTCIAANLTCHL